MARTALLWVMHELFHQPTPGHLPRGFSPCERRHSPRAQPFLTTVGSTAARPKRRNCHKQGPGKVGNRREEALAILGT